jgi:hypothetical protein
MAGRQPKVEQIIQRLREVEVLYGAGATIAEACPQDRSTGADLLPLA